MLVMELLSLEEKAFYLFLIIHYQRLNGVKLQYVMVPVEQKRRSEHVGPVLMLGHHGNK